MMSRGFRAWIGEKAREKKRRVYVSFIDLGNAYDRVNSEALWQLLRMYGVSDKMLSGIKSMYVDSLAWSEYKGVRASGSGSIVM